MDDKFVCLLIKRRGRLQAYDVGSMAVYMSVNTPIVENQGERSGT